MAQGETVLITGGSGLIGRSLSRLLLERGYRVMLMGRRRPRHLPEGVRFAAWDLQNSRMDATALAETDHIIHLAGAGVFDRRWSKAYKHELLHSRIDGISLIHKHLEQQTRRPKTFISGSAIGWYGEDSEPVVPFTENAPPAPDFLGETCRRWEAQAETMADLGLRVCRIRTGIVLSREGGALPELTGPLRFGVAGIPGHGWQFVSWIHIHDLCRLFLHVLEHPALQGAYNGVAPVPVSYHTLMTTLGRIRNGIWYLPLRIPAFFLRGILGERSIELLKSATISAEKIQQSGFTFQYGTVEQALKQLFSSEVAPQE